MHFKMMSTKKSIQSKNLEASQQKIQNLGTAQSTHLSQKLIPTMNSQI